MKKVYLIGRSGIHGNKELPVENEIIIGRDASICQLVYPAANKNISSVHCKIQQIGGNVQLTDMGSTNGTFLDTGVRLAPHSPQTLQNGQGFYLADRGDSFAVRIQESGNEGYRAPQEAAAPVRKQKGSKAFAVTSMVVGIISLVLSLLVPIVSLICGIIGIVFGSIALYQNRPGRKMAIAGLVCSIIGVAVVFLVIVLAGSLVAALLGALS